METEIWIGLAFLAIVFIVTLITTKIWIKIAKKNNLIGKDINKFSKPFVAESGGMAFIFGFVITLFMYIFLKIFYLKTSTHIIETLALLMIMFLSGFIGFLDDISGWKKGINPWARFLFTVPIAIPLILIKAGNTVMSIPFFGAVDFGGFYFLIVLIGFVGATNGVNLLAGYNGLEAGLGAVVLSALGAICLITSQTWLALLAFSAVAALLGFLVYNKFPSKVFPGDSLTFAIGALIASIAILGNIEKIAVFLFIPYIIEGFLKLRSGFRAENFGIPNKDNSLEVAYKKNYSLTHIALRLLKRLKPSHKAYEQEVVLLLIIFEIILAAVAVIQLL